ncbi:acyltransferase family protein [Methylobacterium iners]|uniref:Acyltransferase 3 domain-containing protein n=1 Tax=Methylobacterium iners TaxID=418707 RepID=A0ABQ4S543_9HYPH|nr:acyltransferase [Methylobacterium iners]GJD97609.1 hypothetical protein OCOJLMKI_4842 [Methylobacterium iners]
MNNRLDNLDGLRGVAAVIVVVFHVMSALSPWLVPDQQNGAEWVAYTPIAVLWNGSFAVSVFFVLSGFVVTHATLRKSDPLWIDVPIRYLRIAIPATFSTLFAWTILSIIPNATTELGSVVSSRWLQWTHQGAIPGPEFAIYEGMIGIFLTGGSSFNNVLWTMRPELIGSFACFAICLFRNPQARLCATAVFAIAALLTKQFQYECFVLGIFLREAWAAGRLPSAFPILALMLGLVVGSQSGDAATRLNLEWLPKVFRPGNKNGLLYPMAAALVVYGCMRSDLLTRALSGRIGRFLGAISFPLYLIHVPVIYTFLASAFVLFYSEPMSIILLLITFFSSLLVLSYLFERFVERPFLRTLGKLRRKMRNLRSTNLQSHTGVAKPPT